MKTKAFTNRPPAVEETALKRRQHKQNSLLHYTLVGLAACLAVPTASAGLLLEGDMEAGSFESYGWNPSGNPPEMANSPAPTCRGNYSAKFPLNYDDPVSYRTELTNIRPYKSSKNFNLGEEYWLGFAIYLPDNWQIDDKYEDILLQFHGSPDKDLNEEYRNPPLAISVDKDRWKVTYRADSKKLTSNKDYTLSGSKEVGSIKKGGWTEFVMQIRASYDSDGFVKLWKDGELVLNHQGGIFYNDAKGPYLKMGNYKSAWRRDTTWGGPSSFSSRVHYLDELRIGDGNSSFEEVSPNCGDVNIVKPSAPTLVIK